jgi:protein-S-isoprenylcysteine O-methyltransferase Ste14
MVCSVVIVPTWQVFGLALVHFWLTQLKARNEERHLLAVHGAGYRNYVARTAMFFPKRRAPPQGEAW